MTKFFVVVAALLLVQLASARVARDAPAKPEAPFSELAEKAGDVLKDVESAFFKFVGVDNEDQFKSWFETETKNYATKLDTISKEIKAKTTENVESLKNSEAVKQFSARVDEAIEDLKKKNPTLVENAKDAQDRLTKSVQSIVDEAKKLSENEELSKSIKDVASKVLSTTVDTLKDVNTKIQESTKA